ncbi:MAG: hypothetical protein EHM65_05845, partial [Acidobacteriales bacterium]
MRVYPRKDSRLGLAKSFIRSRGDQSERADRQRMKPAGPWRSGRNTMAKKQKEGARVASKPGTAVAEQPRAIRIRVNGEWHSFRLEGDHSVQAAAKRHPARAVWLAWGPYAILVVMVLLWGFFKAPLNKVTLTVAWPGLHEQVLQVAPVVASPTPYKALYRLEWLSAPGTACLLASLLSALLLGMSPSRFLKVFASTAKQLLFSEITIAAVLGLAFLMNYCGATATLGLAFAATGVLFPFFSSLLGWLGVFLTGSDTSANALFGNLQV